MTTILKSFRNRNELLNLRALSLLCLSLFFLAGCSNQSGLAPQPTPVTVNITTPSTTTLAAGSTITLAASASTGSLVWNVYGADANTCASSSSCGSLSTPTGTSEQFTAPASTPSGTEVVEVRATSSVNQAVFATIDFTITPITVTITTPLASAVSVTAGSVLNLVASVTTTSSAGTTVPDPAGVLWSISGSGCTGSGCGTLTHATLTTVTYSAPSTASTTALSVTIYANSVTDPGENAQLSVTIPPAVVITITPSGSTNIADGGDLGLKASTTNDPTNAGVTWTLTCTIGGTAGTASTCGTLSSITPTSVFYTAPKVPAGALVASVIATSNYTPSINQMQLINVPAAPVITITPPASTVVDDNTSLKLNATVANDINNQGVTWVLTCTINGSAGSGSACGTISGALNSATGTPTASSITYNAPPATPSAIAVTLTATSNANQSVTAVQTLSVPAAPVITINSPAPNTSVNGGASQPVAATVTNDASGKGVTWTLSCNTGNGVVTTTASACGTVTAPLNTATTTTTTASSFTYVAPAAAANPVDVTVTATSNLLPTSIKTLPLVVPGNNAVTVVVSPSSTTVADAATQTLTATVGNDSTNAGVTWSLGCVTNGVATTGASCGALTVTANPTAPYSTVYTAPAYPEYAVNVTVTAASNTANTVTSSSAITVPAAPALTIAITPQPVSPNTVYYAQSGVGLGLTAVVTNDQATPGVTWSVAPAAGTVCPAAGCGTFSAPVTTPSGTQTTVKVTYTPPSGLATLLPVVITATSNSENDVTATLNVSAEVAISFNPLLLGYATAGQAGPFSPTITVTGGMPSNATGTPTYSSLSANPVAPSVLPAWIMESSGPNTITLTGIPPATTGGFSTANSITDGSWATPTTLGTGTLPILVSATDATPNQPLTGTATALATLYNPDEGVGTVPPDNAMMTGTYAFYGTGFEDQTGTPALTASENGYNYPFSIIGSITADGGGNITGDLDMNGYNGYAQYSITGSYSVQSNQLATITLLLPTNPASSITLAVALGGIPSGTDSNGVATTGQFIEYDDYTGNSGNRMSGEMSLVAPSVLSQSSSPLSGSFAFGTQGATPSSAYNSACESAGTCGPVASAGQLTFASSGITGTEDIAYGTTTAPQVSISGALNSSGATDAFGRSTGTMTAANSSLTSWPANYVLYPVNSTLFYFMSIDPYASTTMVAGKAMQQNLGDIQNTPLSGPLVLFGNAFANQAILSPTTLNGGMSAAFALTATSSSATGGTLAATTNPAGALNGYTTGSTTAATKYTAITGISYAVTASSGRVTLSGGSFTPGVFYLGLPTLYLVDTNEGFAVTTPSVSNGNPTGMLVFYPQTGVAGGLNAGNYMMSLYKVNTPTSVTETGIYNLPSTVTSTAVNYTGQMFLSYQATNEESNAGKGSLFDLDILSGSTIAVSSTGVITLGLKPGGPQACNSGVGFMISPTSFVCLANGSGISQQPLYGVQ